MWWGGKGKTTGGRLKEEGRVKGERGWLNIVEESAEELLRLKEGRRGR